MKLIIAGCGYVGRANAEVLHDKFDVTVYDINPDALQGLPCKSTSDILDAYIGAKYIFLCLPTDSKNGRLNTDILTAEIQHIQAVNPDAVVVIRSTVPVGYTENMIEKTGLNIIFYPEFLREGQAIEDIKKPDRVVIGANKLQNFPFVIDTVSLIFCSPSEAEAIKLFSNSYLALRVAFFNELDNYCLENNLDAQYVIKGVSLDHRIGDYYNNPSFGFGGYCLPKDSAELQFQLRHNVLLNAVPDSNVMRKSFIVEYLKKKYDGKKIGVYKLSMKTGSDNSRSSAVIDIIDGLNRPVYIYDPASGQGCIEDLFDCDVIICNRYEDTLKDFRGEIFTRDIFRRD